MSGAPGRLASLDAFRGFAIAAMVLVNNPGSWSHVHGPLAHAAWHGCTFTDLIFPCFLVAAGLSLDLSLGRAAEAGEPRWGLLRRLVRRAAVLCLIGVALNALSTFDGTALRIPGVLQRISLTLLLAAPFVLWGGRRAALVGSFGGFALYLALQLLVPVAGADGQVGAGRLEPGMDFGAWLDRALLGGHLWAKARTWDPEGLLGTLPATANVLMGVLAGRYLRAARGPSRKAPRLLLTGGLLMGAGWLASRAGLPLNKSLWTPSFALFTGGWALGLLGAFHAALDEGPEGLRRRAGFLLRPLAIFGLNALFLFVVSGLLARLLQGVHLGGLPGAPTVKAWLFGAFARLPLSPANASLAFAVAFDLLMFALAWVMWRKRWVVKV